MSQVGISCKQNMEDHNVTNGQTVFEMLLLQGMALHGTTELMIQY